MRGVRPFVLESLMALAAIFGVASAAVAAPWPGSPTVATADVANELGGDVSGLYYESSGSTRPGVLWAVDNGSVLMLRLVWNGAAWVRDATNGWSAGKALSFPGGAGRPDAEGITMTDAGPAGGVFVSSERDLSNPASRISILRYDVSGAAATLSATREWNLTAALPAVGPNAGAESVEWIPDAYLVGARFVDQTTGQRYAPANYPGHGTGLFFIGLEGNGSVYAFALDQTSGSFTLVATFASGFSTFGALHWDVNEQKLWVVCDNNCEGRARVFRVNWLGAFVLVAEYDRPTGLGNLNNEGFAFPADNECVNGRKPVFWADDGNAGGHVLRVGAIDCTTPRNDLLVDLGARGLYKRLNDATWLKAYSLSPLAIAVGDLDNSKKDEAIMSLPSGLFARYDNAGPWVKLHQRPPGSFAIGNIDGVDGDDVVGSFDGGAMWVRYNNKTTWTKLSGGGMTEDLAIGDFDGNGQDDILSDGGSLGLWVRTNKGAFTRAHASSPVRMAVGRFDGNTQDDVVADFGADGLWIRYNNNKDWIKVASATTRALAAGDLDGNGQDEILASLSSGFWIRQNDATWVKLMKSPPTHLATADFDGNGKDEAIFDLGDNRGLWIRYYDGAQVKLDRGPSEGFAAGKFD